LRKTEWLWLGPMRIITILLKKVTKKLRKVLLIQGKYMDR